MMNELQILAATMQQVVMDAVANFRVKPFSDRDVHTYLLFLHGMNLLDRGFLDDAVKMLAASTNGQNPGGLVVLKALATDTRRKDLEYAVNKLEAQQVGYELDSFRLKALTLKYDALAMEPKELIPVVKQHLYDDQPLSEDKEEYYEQLFAEAEKMMKDANTLKWGDYKPWGDKMVSVSSAYEVAIKLFLVCVHHGNTKGLTMVESHLKRNRNEDWEKLVNELKTPEAGVAAPIIEQETENDNTSDMEKHEYNLNRFLLAQELDYDTALMEMQDGAKESHWIWYIFPQLKGLGHSHNSQFYGLDGRDEAIAYLNHPVLGERLREISRVLLQHRKKDIHDIMGSSIDVLKLKTCMKLFDSISPNDVFDEVLDAFFMNEI